MDLSKEPVPYVVHFLRRADPGRCDREAQSKFRYLGPVGYSWAFTRGTGKTPDLTQSLHDSATACANWEEGS